MFNVQGKEDHLLQVSTRKLKYTS